jgi:hypothetical protein
LKPCIHPGPCPCSPNLEAVFSPWILRSDCQPTSVNDRAKRFDVRMIGARILDWFHSWIAGVRVEADIVAGGTRLGLHFAAISTPCHAASLGCAIYAARPASHRTALRKPPPSEWSELSCPCIDQQWMPNAGHPAPAFGCAIVLPCPHSPACHVSSAATSFYRKQFAERESKCTHTTIRSS